MAQTHGNNLKRKLDPSISTQRVSSWSSRDLKSLVGEQYDLKAVDHDGASLLHHAVSNPNTNVLEYLLQKGLSVEARDEKGRTPLLSCAFEGILENISLLIAHGANVRARDKDGLTAIHYASLHSKSSAVISSLVKAGANIDERDTRGRTAFHTCALFGNVDGMVSLIDEGANFLERGVKGETAFHHAVLDGTSRATEFLLTFANKINAVNDENMTHLQVYSAKSPTKNTMSLVKAGADLQALDINARDDRGRTPLHLSSAKGALRSTMLLVEAGADLEAVDNDGLTALHFAAMNQNTPAIIQYLWGHGIASDSRDEEGDTPLHKCAQSGNLKNLRELLKVDPDVQRKNYLGRNALHHAAMNKEQNGMLAHLLNSGMSIDARDDSGNAAIHFSAGHGTKNDVELLLRRGSDIDIKGAEGQTPLFWALHNENAQEMIGFLLSQGASMNLRDEKGNSPLHHCATQGNLKIAKFLVDNGADIGAKNADGMTALRVALSKRKNEMVEYLLRKDAWKSEHDGLNDGFLIELIQKGSLQSLKLILEDVKISRLKDNGLTALHHAASNEQSGVLELVIDQSIPLETNSNNGSTPLHCCAATGTPENLEVLLRRGADVQARDREGKTAMHYAVSNEYMPAIVEILLKNGLSIESRDNFERTPLHHCAEIGSLENMKALIDMGADIDALSNEWTTALHFASTNRRTSDIINFLIDQCLPIDALNESGFTALHLSIMSQNESNTKLLLEKGAYVEARAEEDSLTALHLAASHGDTTETLQILLEKGAPIEARDSSGETPLLTCAHEGNLQKMKLLVENGADIQERDEEDVSALHFAAVNKKTTDIMQFLLDKGMPLDVKDILGRTPLHLSAADGNLQSVKFLCERGADPKSLDKNKMSALHYATNNVEGGPIIEYLLANGLRFDVQDDLVDHRQSKRMRRRGKHHKTKGSHKQ